jgi:hypothetical protein
MWDAKLTKTERLENSKSLNQFYLESFKDEFETDGSEYPKTPGIPMKTLQLGD